MFTFLKTVFSSLNSDDINLATSVKNAIAVCILVSGLVFRSASSKSTRDFVGMFHMAVVLGLMVLLDTRSVIIAGVGGILLAIGLKSITHTGRGSAILGVKALAAVAALTMVIGFTNSDAVTGLMADRFSFEDASAEARVEQYQVAMDRIEQHPWMGSGYYLIDGYPVHNLFLSAWMNAGIAAFLAALAFYLILVAKWVSFVWRLVTQPKRWTSRRRPNGWRHPPAHFSSLAFRGRRQLVPRRMDGDGNVSGNAVRERVEARTARRGPKSSLQILARQAVGIPAVFPGRPVSRNPMASKR